MITGYTVSVKGQTYNFSHQDGLENFENYVEEAQSAQERTVAAKNIARPTPNREELRKQIDFSFFE